MFVERFVRRIQVFALGVLLTSACTRSVDLKQTPLMAPLLAPEQPGKAATLAALPTPTPGAAVEISESNLTPTSGAEAAAQKYAVVFLADGEVLNVRSGPGVMNEVIGSLPANARDLSLTGQQEDENGLLWFEVALPEGGKGWVSSGYLSEQASPEQVCNDPAVGNLLDQLVSAVQGKDGNALAAIVSPRHGLVIQHNVWNPPVVLKDPEVIAILFDSSSDYDWGIQDASGEPMVGPFKDHILPKLENVLLQNHTRHCNTLERGVATAGTTGNVYWPYDYANLNYVALFRPPPPEQELDWRTWAAGIEYVDGKPYLAVLIQFYWEI